MSPAEFRHEFGFEAAAAGGGFVQTKHPQIGNGKNAEPWFEAVNWVMAAIEAKDCFSMISLGASFGAQAVGAWRALKALNPLSCRLVTVEPVPDKFDLLVHHFQQNGIDPHEHWILPMAVSASTDPVLFQFAAPGSGAQDGHSTNEIRERKRYLSEFLRSGFALQAFGDLLLHNTTSLVPKIGLKERSAVVKYVSAITLAELLAPFDHVDLLASDIQPSEAVVFPPFLSLLKAKVRRLHIGTHSRTAHASLHHLFAHAGWEIVFSYEPSSAHDSELGRFKTSDGILTLRNPDLTAPGISRGPRRLGADADIVLLRERRNKAAPQAAVTDAGDAAGLPAAIRAHLNKGLAAVSLELQSAVARAISEGEERVRTAVDLSIDGTGESVVSKIIRKVSYSEESIRTAIVQTLSQTEESVRVAVDRKVSDSEDSIRTAIDRKVSDSEDSIRAAVDRKVSDSEESILTAVERKVSDSEESILTAINRKVFDSEEAIRTYVEKAIDRLSDETRAIRPNRSVVLIIALGSAMISAILVATLLTAARLLLF